MTACRHHVLEQGFGPKTNGVYTWRRLSVVSGLAQASYTVQRIEAQATKQTNKTKKKATILPTAIFGQIFFVVFVVFGFVEVFWCFGCFGLVGFFVFFSESFGNSRKWSTFHNFRTLSIISALFSETALFAAPIRSASLKLM